MKSSLKGLGERIRHLRLERRLTPIQVRDKTGIDQATLSRIENESMIGTVDSHLRLARVLGVDIAELLYQWCRRYASRRAG